MSRKYSIDSNDTIDSRSYSTDDSSNTNNIKFQTDNLKIQTDNLKIQTNNLTIKTDSIKIPTNKYNNKIKRRKRDQPLSELSISPSNKEEQYRQYLLIFNKNNYQSNS